MLRRPLAALLLAVLLVPALACSDGSPTDARGPGVLAVRLTDAPTQGASEVKVHIVGLTVKAVGEPGVRIAGDLGVHDLLLLQDTSALLVQAGVAPGDYEFVQVELDADGSSVVEVATGETKPLAIASEEIKVLGGFTVAADGTTTILLDFDAQASLRQLGNGDWLLTPVISLANVAQT